MLDIYQYECEVCDTSSDSRDRDAQDDIDCIIENKRCRDCYDEYGDEWPDRI